MHNEQVHLYILQQSVTVISNTSGPVGSQEDKSLHIYLEVHTNAQTRFMDIPIGKIHNTFLPTITSSTQ